MNKVLFISIDTIFPLTSGYRKSVFGRICEASSNATVYVIEFDIGENNAALAPEGFGNATFLRVFHPWTSSRWKKSILNVISCFSLLPRLMYIYASRKFTEAVASTIADLHPDSIIIESIWCAHLVPKSFNGSVTLVSHDIAGDYLLEMSKNSLTLLKRLAFRLDAIKLRRIERSIYANKSLQHVFLTREDQAWYSRVYSIQNSSVATNDLSVKKIYRSPNFTDSFFLYAGSLTFSQNYSAILWYAEHIYPLLCSLQKTVPPVIVTGKTNQSIISSFRKFSFINFSGELSELELEDMQSRCLAMLSPIVSGSGIKIKNLEAVQKGVPVIMTPFSARGINPSDSSFIAESDSAKSFAAEMHNFLERVFQCRK